MKVVKSEIPQCYAELHVHVLLPPHTSIFNCCHHGCHGNMTLRHQYMCTHVWSWLEDQAIDLMAHVLRELTIQQLEVTQTFCNCHVGI